MALFYLPALPETPNLFFRDDASAAELAQWKAHWNTNVTMMRMHFLSRYVLDDAKVNGNTVDPTRVEAWAIVPGHPLREDDAVTVIVYLYRCNEIDARDGTWVALARRVYAQLTTPDRRTLAQNMFPQARLGQPDE
jgi:hypothetical protein